MASNNGNVGKEGDGEKDLDPELDITNEKFNPYRALYAPEFKITKKMPKVIYQNLAAFESSLKRYGIWNLNKAQNIASGSKQTGKINAEVEQNVPIRRFELHQMAVETMAKRRQQRNLYSHMAGVEGPLNLLNELRLGGHLKVSVRKKNGIRGTIVGQLIAFDKQWNLLLRNVVETWRRRKFKYGQQNICGSPQDCAYILSQLNLSFPKLYVRSIDRKTVEITRELNQILLRGEQVVLISMMKNES